MNIEDYKSLMCPFCGNYKRCEEKGIKQDTGFKTSNTYCLNYAYVPKKEKEIC